MSERPEIDENLDSHTFKDFYYLKEELVAFCRKEGLQISGGKIELTDRIAYYLDTREKKVVIRARKVTPHIGNITEESIIESDFVCSEKHRAFFKEAIGKSFSFPVVFQKWLKENTGKTYKDAIESYYLIAEEKKKGTTKIDKQFEYNTYIRDFHAANEGKSLEDSIRCWKYKKSLPGHNKYEKDDLIVIL